MKKQLSVNNLLYNIVAAVLLCAVAGFPLVFGVFVAIVAGTILSYVKLPNGALFEGVQKEIWTDILLEKFYPDTSFMNEARNLDSLVEYNTINLADAGADPDVLVDNSSYPISTSSRTDAPIQLPLRTLDTTSTVHRNIEKKESSYDKMSSIIYGHRMALQTKAGQLAAWNYAPAKDTKFTPVLKTTGKPRNGFATCSFDDIFDLEARQNEVDAPQDGRILVLTPTHQRDLKSEDSRMFKEMISSGRIGTFKLYSFSSTPKYDATTGLKLPFGAAAGANDTVASFAFHKDEVMRAMGTVEMFAKYSDPDQKGDVMNFQMRFVALALRNKTISAIYSAKA
ncbi:hypothetical protein KTO58_19790 [Chitinophaga pendula]|uniref:hypothetical protein n=1 Tax=Chitinophaga TaxID=79328 RepID=UPI000BAEEDD0|nr:MULTISPECIES: hypothetical protein [Chitinophaga]ASZ11090.1 hypothetical protein CK934_09010 [Chitinophaga sp. MD30]UCJ05913.1 hypothetical protein KTO58_19790 [Chitinophaga pendula]